MVIKNLLLAVLLTLAATSILYAQPQITTLPPNVSTLEQNITKNGGQTSYQWGGGSLMIGRLDDNDFFNRFRTVLAFSWGVIPTDARINSVSLTVTIGMYSSGSSKAKIVNLSGTVSMDTAGWAKFDNSGTIYFSNLQYDQTNNSSMSNATLTTDVTNAIHAGKLLMLGVMSLNEGTDQTNASVDVQMVVNWTPKITVTIQNSFSGGSVWVDAGPNKSSPWTSGPPTAWYSGDSHSIRAWSQSVNGTSYTFQKQWHNLTTGEWKNQTDDNTPIPISPTANCTWQAIFDQGSVQITAQNSFGGGYLHVDGTDDPHKYNSPAIFSWSVGSGHTLQADNQYFVDPANGQNYYRVFQDWSDQHGTHYSTNPLTITVPAGGAIYTANFKKQYNITVSAASYTEPGTGGTYNVTAADGTHYNGVVSWNGTFIQDGSSPITVAAVPPTGFFLAFWSNGVTSNPYTFTPTDHTTLYAVYKKHLASSNSTATGPNNQIKIMKNASKFHMVYESGGEIWYTNSTDGVNWSSEIRLSDGGGSYKNPSLSCYSVSGYDYIQVIWASSDYPRFRENRNDIGWESQELLSNILLSPTVNTTPVVNSNWAALNCPSGGGSKVWLLRRLGYNNWKYDVPPVPNVTIQSYAPAILLNGGMCHLVFQESSAGSILYNKIDASYNWQYATSTVVSSGCSLTSNGSPSIATDDGGYIYVAWHGLNSARNENEIVVRGVTGGTWDPTFQYFYSGLPSSPTPPSYYNPVIFGMGEQSAYNMGMVWWASDNTLRAARYISSNGSWATYEISTGSTQYPTAAYQKDGTGATVDMIYRTGTSSPYQLQPMTEGSSNPYSLALGNQSSVSTATAYDNQRKLYRESSGTLHEVFESSGEIFYRKSTDGGSTWQLTREVSSGSGGNSAACITMAGSTIIVAWQQATGSNYNIVTKKSTDGGSSWSSETFPQTNFSCSSPGPVPSVCGYSTGRVFVSYRTSSNLSFVMSTNYGGSWTSPASIPNSTGNYNMPSSAIYQTYWSSDQLNIAYATDVSSGSPQINSTYYESGSWGTLFNLTSIVPSNYVQHANPCLAVSSDSKSLHVVWDAYDNTMYQRVIVHRQGDFRSFSSVYSILRYQSQNKPSIAGLSSANAWATFQNESGYGTWKSKYSYNGSAWTWGSQTYIADGFNTQISVGSSSAKYLYTSTHVSPYQLTVGTETLTKLSDFTDWTYSREMNIIDNKNGTSLTFELTQPIVLENDGSILEAAFRPASGDSVKYTFSTLLQVGETMPMFIPATSDSLYITYSLMGTHVPQLFSDGNGYVQFQLVNQHNGNVLATLGKQQLSSIADNNRDIYSLVIPVSNIASQLSKLPLIIRPIIIGVRTDSTLIASLGHIYRGEPLKGTSKVTAQLDNISQTLLRPSDYALGQNYPNPFNPTTSINYQVPVDNHVTLKVYNVLGQGVKTLVDEVQDAGFKSVKFDATNLPSGMYYVRMTVSDSYGKQLYMSTKKLLLMK
ncbi:MAG: T9SS type A sorting domain-containing protein [Bacteroidota bacterium]|jgi:hypothetical protein